MSTDFLPGPVFPCTSSASSASSVENEGDTNFLFSDTMKMCILDSAKIVTIMINGSPIDQNFSFDNIKTNDVFTVAYSDYGSNSVGTTMSSRPSPLVNLIAMVENAAKMTGREVPMWYRVKYVHHSANDDIYWRTTVISLMSSNIASKALEAIWYDHFDMEKTMKNIEECYDDYNKELPKFFSVTKSYYLAVRAVLDARKQGLQMVPL